MNAQSALDALGHSPRVSDTCTARVKPLPPEARKPGPQNPPIFCCLKAGHEGPHRCNHGGMTFPSFPFRESDEVEFREPLALCTKCRVKWPCADAQKVIAALAAPEESGNKDDLIARLQHYVDHLGDMQDGLAGGDPQAVRDALDELLRHRAAGVESFDFYWLVELFRPYGGNSLGQFDAPGSPTTRPVEAYRYATRKDAEYAASKCDAGPDTEWRAAEHGFLRAAPSKEAGAVDDDGPCPSNTPDCPGVAWFDFSCPSCRAGLAAEEAAEEARLAALANPPGDQRQEREQSCGFWRPMETAPRDGTLLRLLVRFTEHPTEDADAGHHVPTIGANSFDNTGDDEWKFAGWSWTQDCFTQGAGTPAGWLPMLGQHQPAEDEDAQYEVRADGQRVRKDRWETGFRNIVTIMVGPRTEFEIADIVEHVRALAAPRKQSGPDLPVDIDAIVACLGDDAAAMLEEDAEDMRAHTMQQAAELITRAAEFGEYMAKGAEHLIDSLNAYHVACGEDGDEPDPDVVAAAEEKLSEAMTGLRSDVYEFRKRAASPRTEAAAADGGAKA